MVSLVDIVPQTRTVQLTGGEIELRGLGLRQVAGLLMQFPTLYRAFADGFEPLALIIAMPDAVGMIIAEAAGQPEAGDNIAAAMPIDDLVECLVAVGALTMPGGVDPFVRRLAGLLAGLAAAPNGRAADIHVPPLPSN